MFRANEDAELIEGEPSYVLRGGLYICHYEIRTDLVFLSIGKNETSTSNDKVKAKCLVTLDI
jgi:hypothetical protein